MPLDSLYPDPSSQPNRYAFGPMVNIEGKHSAPPPGAPPLPTSLGGNTDLASALEGTLSDMRAAAQETKNAMRDISIMAQRVSSTLGGTTGSEPSLPINKVAGIGGGAGAGLTSADVAVLGASMGLSYGSAMRAGPQPVAAYNVNGMGVGASPIFQAFTSSYTGEIVNNVAGSVEPANAPVNQVPGGGWHPASSQEQTVAEQIELAQGGKKGMVTPKSSERLTSESYAEGYELGHAPSLAKIGTFLQKHTGAARRSGRVASAINAAASGASGSGVLEALAPEIGGPLLVAGAAVGAVGFGLHEIEAQRSQNAAYQSIEGGSNFGGFVERAREGLFGLSQLGDLGMGQANQLFEGVTQIGLKGGQRQNALDFAIQQYNQLGMSISDSLQLISVSAKAGHDNLQQLSSVLDSVTQSAAAASTNTEVARQNFVSMYQGAIANGMSTTGAAFFAGGSASLTAQLGTTGQGVQYGQASNAQAAAALGMSYNDYEAGIAMGGSAAANLQARGQQAVMNQMLNPVGAGIPDLKGMAGQAYSHKLGGSSALAQTLLRRGYTTEQIMGMLQTAGIQGVNSSNMWEVLGGVLSGQSSLTNSVSATEQERTSDAAAVAAINRYVGSKPMAGYAGRAGEGNTAAARETYLNTLLNKESTSQSDIDTYISKHGLRPGSGNVLTSLLENDTMGSLKVNGTTTSILDALGNSSLLGQIQNERGVSIDGPGGKEESLARWMQTHNAAAGSSRLSTSPKKSSGGQYVVTLSPSAAQLFQLVLNQNGISAAQLPPTGVSTPGFTEG